MKSFALGVAACIVAVVAVTGEERETACDLLAASKIGASLQAKADDLVLSDNNEACLEFGLVQRVAVCSGSIGHWV